MNSTSQEILPWREAIYNELQTLTQKQTWRKAGNLPNSSSSYRVSSIEGKTVLPSHVVLKIKRDKNGNPEKFKARVVAGGTIELKVKTMTRYMHQLLTQH